MDNEEAKKVVAKAKEIIIPLDIMAFLKKIEAKAKEWHDKMNIQKGSNQ